MRQPFLPLFFGDLLASTPTWDGEERALYLLMLAYQWSAGALPNDTRRLAKMCQYDQPVFDRLWAQVGTKFPITEAGLVNQRLEQHRKKADEIAAKNAQAGRAGAAKRWRNDGERHSDRDSERDSERHDDRYSETYGETHSIHTNPNHTNPNQSKPKKKEVGLTTNVRPEVLTVFSHWQTVHGHHDSKLSEKRKTIIVRALIDYSVEQLCESISGYKHSPHHMGQNDRNTVYDSIELILRDAAKIDAGLAFARNPPKKTGAVPMSAAIANWVPKEFRDATE